MYLNNYDFQNIRQVFTGIPIHTKHVFTRVPKIPKISQLSKQGPRHWKETEDFCFYLEIQIFEVWAPPWADKFKRLLALNSMKSNATHWMKSNATHWMMSDATLNDVKCNTNCDTLLHKLRHTATQTATHCYTNCDTLLHKLRHIATHCTLYTQVRRRTPTHK